MHYWNLLIDWKIKLDDIFQHKIGISSNISIFSLTLRTFFTQENDWLPISLKAQQQNKVVFALLLIYI